MSEEDPGVGQHWLGNESRDIRTGHRGNKTLNDFKLLPHITLPRALLDMW